MIRHPSWLTRMAMQRRGAIGSADDYAVGLYLRRAMVTANQSDSAAPHRSRFVATAPEEGVQPQPFSAA